MLQRKIALVCLALVIASVAGVALAKAVKVELVPWSDSVAPEPDASGHAILNYAKGADKTEVQVNCWGLTPETDYTVYLNNGSWYSIGTFTTNGYGDGNLHVKLAGDASGDQPVAVNNSELNATVLMSE